MNVTPRIMFEIAGRLRLIIFSVTIRDNKNAMNNFKILSSAGEVKQTPDKKGTKNQDYN